MFERLSKVNVIKIHLQTFLFFAGGIIKGFNKQTTKGSNGLCSSTENGHKVRLDFVITKAVLRTTCSTNNINGVKDRS